MRCVIDDGCCGPIRDDAPLPLCDRHLEIAAEHSAAGRTDVLPGPCLACGSRLGVHYPSGWLCAACEWRFGDAPEPDLAPVRVDIVYYLGFRDRIKIGTTVNPRQRFAAILHDDVLAFERGDRVLERTRHAQFSSERLERSEWFAASDALRDHIDVVAGGVDPWDRYARWMSEAAALRA